MQFALCTVHRSYAIVRFGGREYRGGEGQGEETDKGIEYLEFALIYFRQLERGKVEEEERKNRQTRRKASFRSCGRNALSSLYDLRGPVK